jgi:hypothetical protein
MFTHPTENQLSDLACDNYFFNPKDAGRTLSHLETFLEPCDLKPGDIIDIDEDDWQLVTAYNADGFGEVFIAEPKDGKWKHTWLMYKKKGDEKAEVRCLRKEVVLANMDEDLRIPAEELPSRPTFITPHACNGLNGCCQKERARS